MAKLNLVSVLDKLEKEGRNPLQSANNGENPKTFHPYHGLEDERGSLTRYPAARCVAPAQWLEEYISLGGKLDGLKVWGIDPTEREFYYNEKRERVYQSLPWEDFSPAQAARFLLAAHCQRWDNVPRRPESLEFLSEDIEFRDYKYLIAGIRLKERFSRAGVQLSNSLLTLGRRANNLQWQLNRLGEQFNPKNEHARSILWNLIDQPQASWDDEYIRIELNVPENPILKKVIEDMNEFQEKATESSHFFSSNMTRRPYKEHKTEKTVSTVATVEFMLKHRYWDGVNRLVKAEAFSFDYFFNRHTTSEGVLVVTKNAILKIGRLDGGNNLAVVEKATIRQKMGTNIAKIGDTYFAWGEYFESHKEGNTLREALHNLNANSSFKAKVVNQLKTSGEISFHEFQKATHSCIAGTRSFLKEFAPFLAALLNGYNSWTEFFLSSPAANETFALTPEFISKFEHRF